MWIAWISSEQIYSLSCIVTLIVSLYSFFSLGPLLRGLKEILVQFYQRQMSEYMAIQSIPGQGICPAELVVPSQMEQTLPQEVTITTPSPKRSRLLVLPVADAYCRKMRKQNKFAMKNSYKRSFYFPNKDYIINGQTQSTQLAHNLNYNLVKLAQRFKRPKVKRRQYFMPTSLPPILEFEIY